MLFMLCLTLAEVQRCLQDFAQNHAAQCAASPGCFVWSVPRQRPACLQEDGGVIKRIITPGTGWETPSKGSEVTGEPAQRC